LIAPELIVLRIVGPGAVGAASRSLAREGAGAGTGRGSRPGTGDGGWIVRPVLPAGLPAAGEPAFGAVGYWPGEVLAGASPARRNASALESAAPVEPELPGAAGPGLAEVYAREGTFVADAPAAGEPAATFWPPPATAGVSGVPRVRTISR
jgi:hypothetical protein